MTRPDSQWRGFGVILAGLIAALAAESVPGADQTPLVVINEIHYLPQSVNHREEFIELFNGGTESVDLSGWRLIEGIDFTVPKGTVIPAKSYLCITADKAAFQARYPDVQPVIGDFQGKLNDSGELLRLCDQRGRVMDVVSYDVGNTWPPVADIEGYSLELRMPSMPNDDGYSWDTSIDEGGSPGRKNSITPDNYLDFPVPPHRETVITARREEDDERRDAAPPGPPRTPEAYPTPVPAPTIDAPRLPAGMLVYPSPLLGPSAVDGTAGRVTVLYFHMDVASPCREQLTLLRHEGLPTTKANTDIILVDVRRAREVSQRYDIFKVPTWVFLDSNGKEVTRLTELVSSQTIGEKMQSLQ